MKLFTFKKEEKKEEDKITDIMVLGACCKKSKESFENVLLAAKELQIDEEIVNVKDNGVIASYGVMQTPALMIHNKVVCYGKYISEEDAKQFLLKYYGK